MKKRILAIETSCDDTSIAILEENYVIAQKTFSQIETHSKFGGVIPEIASRLHTKSIFQLIFSTLEDANCNLKEIDAIAFTIGPGLINALQVGITVAKSLALALNIPLYPINHLVAHAYSPFIGVNTQVIPEKALVIIASGGHSIIAVKEKLNFKTIGQTRDDAIGEAYDKVGKLLGYSYPAGQIIDEISQKNGNNTDKVSFTIPKISDYDLSFSGIKSSVYNYIKKNKTKNLGVSNEEIATAFQKVAIEHFLEKIKKALNNFKLNKIILGGGVAANSYLRFKLEAITDLQVYLPKLAYTSDNAAMIGYAFFVQKRFNEKIGLNRNDLLLDAKPNLNLEDR